MSSLNTNVAAMTALQTLSQTNKEMLVTQNRISTGLRVGSAADNAAYWSIATTMRSDNMSVSTVADALGFGSALADVTESALKNTIDTISKIKEKLVAARTPGLDRAKIQTEIEALQDSLVNTAKSAVFSGQNWLQGDSTAATLTKSIVASFSRDSSGSITIGTIEVDVSATTGSGMMLFDADHEAATPVAGGILGGDRTVGGSTFTVASLNISALTDDAADLTIIEEYITGVDNALTEVTNAATQLGSVKSRISLQQTFVAKLMDAIDTGIGQLIDADMNEESTRLQALQVRQQLGVQALGIANQSAQQILALFNR